MRIDAISIENIASLLGQQQVIDLRATDGPLGGAGLIAITGPTGAGKSTVLDCICLALFGQTPRQPHSSGEPGALISRAAWIGRVAVDIALDDGARWRVSWAMARARKELTGRLQAVERSITDLGSGEIVADTITTVTAMVKERLHLTIDQFRSVVMLAQGEFARFLRAADQDRAGLLELLTGTGIYTRLGKAAYDQWRELDQACATSDAALAQVTVLADDARAALVGERTTQDQAIIAATARSDQSRRDRDAGQAFLVHRQAVSLAQQELTDATTASAAAAPDRERLSRADAAIPLLAPIAAATGAESRVIAQRDVQSRATGRLHHDQSAALDASTAAGQLIVRATSAAEAAQQNATLGGPWAKIMSSDIRILQEKRSEVTEAGRLVAVTRSTVTQTADIIPIIDLEVTSARTAHAATTLQLEHGKGAKDDAERAMAEALGGHTVDTVQARQRSLHAACSVLREVVPNAVAIQQTIARTDQERGEAEAALEQARAAAALAQQAVDAQVTLLDRLTELAKLTAFTHLVVEGEPCPLCGAADHPKPLAMDDHGATRARTELVRLRALNTSTETKANGAQLRVQSLSAVIEQHRVAHDAAIAGMENRQRRWLPIGAVLELPSDITAVSAQEVDHHLDMTSRLIKAYDLAQTVYQQRWQALTPLTQRRHDSSTALITAEQKAEHARQRMAEAIVERDQAAKRLEEGTASLHHHLVEVCRHLQVVVPDLAGPWIDALPTRCEEARTQASVARTARIDAEELSTAWHRCAPAGSVLQTAIDGPSGPVEAIIAEARLSQRVAEERHQAVQTSTAKAEEAATAVATAQRDVDDTRLQLATALAGSPYADLAAVRAAMLLDSERELLREQLVALNQRLAVASDHRDRAHGAQDQARAALIQRGLDPDEPFMNERLSVVYEADARAVEVLLRRRGELGALIDHDDQSRGRRDLLIAGQQVQRVARDRLARLKELIGCATGSRFNRCAQALTLDTLLELANLRLVDLAPRYQLRRESESTRGEPGLGLLVIDHDQADGERAISTLSGGETFLVSIALALALADLHRGRLKVETLCIDEGFGTLDEQTLSQAMATLDRLQQVQGTQILLISHVGALHDRIAHRIEVVRRGGGSSWLRLVGPDRTSDHMPELPAVAASDAADDAAMTVLLSAISSRGGISSAEGQELTHRSAAATRSLLKRLVQRGEVGVTGQGRGVRYVVVVPENGQTVARAP